MMLIRQLSPDSAADQRRALEYMRAVQGARPGMGAAAEPLLASLRAASSGSLLAWVNQCLAQGQPELAAAWLDQIVPRRRAGHDEVFVWALAHWQQGQTSQARAILEELLRVFPASYPGLRLLAELERSEGRLAAAAARILAFAAQDWHDPEIGLALVGFLSDSRRLAEALELCQIMLARAADPRFSAMAAQLALHLGHFDGARQYAQAAIASGIDLELYYLPRVLSMCQLYQDPGHADFALFKQQAERLKAPGAKAALRFAWGKACDDLGQYQQAAEHFKAANALARPTDRDPAADWLAVERAIMSMPPLQPLPAGPVVAPVPVFIVGLPRTGSSLLASRLAIHPEVCDRGELPTIAFIYRQLQAAGRLGEPAAMAEAALLYTRHLQQDDRRVGWYLDKEPMNFGHLGLIRALFPQAKVIWCRRRARETVLSIWMQHFSPGSLDYAYDFKQIRSVLDSASRMMAHWRGQLPSSMLLEVAYEDMVEAPAAILGQIYQFLGLPGAVASSAKPTGAVATSSAWQVRQPIHRGSLDKSRHYLPWIPELSGF